MGLVLSRKVGESVMIGDDVEVTFVKKCSGDKIRLAIDAPARVSVHRKEVWDEVKAGKGKK